MVPTRVLVSTLLDIKYNDECSSLKRRICSSGGEHIPGNNDEWNIGTGAGLYLDATQDPWKENYRMYTYVTEELPAILEENFPILSDKQSMMGHR